MASNNKDGFSKMLITSHLNYLLRAFLVNQPQWQSNHYHPHSTLIHSTEPKLDDLILFPMFIYVLPSVTFMRTRTFSNYSLKQMCLTCKNYLVNIKVLIVSFSIGFKFHKTRNMSILLFSPEFLTLSIAVIKYGMNEWVNPTLTLVPSIL